MRPRKWQLHIHVGSQAGRRSKEESCPACCPLPFLSGVGGGKGEKGAFKTIPGLRKNETKEDKRKPKHICPQHGVVSLRRVSYWDA